MPEETAQATTEGSESTEQQQTAEGQQTNQEGSQSTGEAEGSKDEGTLLGGKDEGSDGDDGGSDGAEGTYTVKLPEGMEADTGMVEALTPVLKDIGITNEQFQQIADVYAPEIKKQFEAQQAEAVKDWQKTTDEWAEATKKEQGDELKVNLGVAGKFMDKYGDKEARQILNDTGLGNHPAIVRLFIKAGKAISEDTFVDPEKTNKPTRSGIDLKKMYPSMKE